ncbi:MAG TPA: cobyric acid synthase, partial [Burkholderiaceae bacterium]|nr:cobyric acid synthase [Burkholderiaceae bacterium]
NLGTARDAKAACLLVTDIDRGGAFAHLYGTHQLMPEDVRSLVRGFVLNKFRGDAALLAPAPEQLQALTGVPTLAVLPMQRDHGLPEEDEVPAAHAGAGPRVVVLAYPHASNLDEFEPLRAAGVALACTRDTGQIAAADWLVLPGSKHTRADLAWLREQGLDHAIHAHAARGRPLLALCGGLQLLGQRLEDPLGLEGGTNLPGDGVVDGLGLLPLVTRFEPVKHLACATHRFATLTGPWAPLSGLQVEGYEIHLGRSQAQGLDAALPSGDPAAPLGWQRGPVLALYLHGLFENPAVVQALFGVRGRPLEAAFDALADCVDAHFKPGALMALLETSP